MKMIAALALLLLAAPSRAFFAPQAFIGTTRQYMSSNSVIKAAVGDDYEVRLIPHPDFGIGLRFAAQQDGMPALAGSFKKHPSEFLNIYCTVLSSV